MKRVDEIRKLLRQASQGERSVERLEGHSDATFRYEVRTFGEDGGFVAFYEESYDKPMRAKFDAQLFLEAPGHLEWACGEVERLNRTYVPQYIASELIHLLAPLDVPGEPNTILALTKKAMTKLTAAEARVRELEGVLKQLRDGLDGGRPEMRDAKARNVGGADAALRLFDVIIRSIDGVLGLAVGIDPAAPGADKTGYALHCQDCGLVPITLENYEQQLADDDAPWFCPKCGDVARDAREAP